MRGGWSLSFNSVISLVVIGALGVMVSGCGHDVAQPPPPPPTPRHHLAPRADTTMSGRAVYDRITIPSGVVVTASDPLALVARGEARIEGTLQGPADAGLSLQSDSTIIVSGTIRNDASGAAPATAAPVLLVGRGGIRLNGAILHSSGRIVLLNDSLDVDGTLSGAASSAPISITSSTLSLLPSSARPGSPSIQGAVGSDGGDLFILARGVLTIAGRTELRAQGGGAGGAGQHQDPSAALAEGGTGGDGGSVTLRSRTRIDVAPAALCTIQSGDGGDGGRADATGLPSGSTNVAASAVARGGHGGGAGTFTIESNDAMEIQGAIDLESGAGGNGAVGNALGADGLPADTEFMAQKGGDADARGGAGGASPASQLGVFNLTGGSLNQGGGAGGDGGPAVAVPGRGGTGGTMHRDGGPGGDAVARGGDGGSCGVLVNGAPVSAGGNGGSVLVQGGRGGEGYNACLDLSPTGGDGGSGGNVQAEDGEPGNGTPAGTANGVALSQCANGGGGGRGTEPGNGGQPGARNVTAHGPINETAPLFSFGTLGGACGGGTGACCTLGGTCTIEDGDRCTQAGGIYRGNDSTCETVNCDFTTGACCAPDGSCTVVTAAACIDGTFGGLGSDCSPNPCTAAIGACCFEGGGCEIRTADACAESNGSYHGDNTACDPNPCPIGGRARR